MDAVRALRQVGHAYGNTVVVIDHRITGGGHLDVELTPLATDLAVRRDLLNAYRADRLPQRIDLLIGTQRQGAFPLGAAILPLQELPLRCLDRAQGDRRAKWYVIERHCLFCRTKQGNPHHLYIIATPILVVALCYAVGRHRQLIIAITACW